MYKIHNKLANNFDNLQTTLKDSLGITYDWRSDFVELNKSLSGNKEEALLEKIRQYNISHINNPIELIKNIHYRVNKDTGNLELNYEFKRHLVRYGVITDKNSINALGFNETNKIDLDFYEWEHNREFVCQVYHA